jgi:hypothetical protein
MSYRRISNLLPATREFSGEPRQGHDITSVPVAKRTSTTLSKEIELGLESVGRISICGNHSASH